MWFPRTQTLFRKTKTRLLICFDRAIYYKVNRAGYEDQLRKGAEDFCKSVAPHVPKRQPDTIGPDWILFWFYEQACVITPIGEDFVEILQHFMATVIDVSTSTTLFQMVCMILSSCLYYAIRNEEGLMTSKMKPD